MDWGRLCCGRDVVRPWRRRPSRPPSRRSLSLDSSRINAIFFAGSIPFTATAYLQLFQAANADERPDAPPNSNCRRFVIGWQPDNIGWLSTLLQFIGTVLFNLKTFDALTPSLDWLQQDLLIWMPDMTGSILFLASGYLAFVETCHACWGWQPANISWWVVFANLLGCLAFMVSAICAVALPFPISSKYLTASVLFTLLGAIGFLVGFLLMLPEAALEPEY